MSDAEWALEGTDFYPSRIVHHNMGVKMDPVSNDPLALQAFTTLRDKLYKDIRETLLDAARSDQPYIEEKLLTLDKTRQELKLVDARIEALVANTDAPAR